MKNPLFPEIPEDISPEKISDEDLTAALDGHIAIVRKIKANDEEIIAAVASGDELAAATEAGVADVMRMRDEIASRKEGEVALAAKIEELTADIGDEPTPEPEPAPDGDEPAAEAAVEVPIPDAAEPVAEGDAPVVAEVVDAAEPVLAAAPRFTLPKASPQHMPLPEAGAETVALTASAGLATHGEGAVLDRRALAEAMIDKHYRANATAAGVREKVVVASAEWSYPAERRLDPRDTSEATQAKIDAVVGEEALTASGGLCAPVTNYYELANVSVADRPVRDSLAAFQAVRGGLKFAAVPVLGDVTTAISYITEDEDAQGGTFATKSCQIVECPPFSEVDVAIIAHCIQFGNLGSRAFPEQVAQFTDLVMAAHARVAETALLDNISAASTQVTAATATYGYAGTGGLLGEILTAAAGIRSRNRMADGARLRVILPAWVKSWLVSDLVNSQFQRFEHTIDGVVALLRTIAGVEPSFTLDGQTGQAQVYGAQGAGALLAFPPTIRWYIFPEGSWLFLDGGELELGVVRDSVLNATNDFQVFGETFENVAFVGVESLAVTSTICPAGTTGGPATSLLC